MTYTGNSPLNYTPVTKYTDAYYTDPNSVDAPPIKAAASKYAELARTGNVPVITDSWGQSVPDQSLWLADVNQFHTATHAYAATPEGQATRPGGYGNYGLIYDAYSGQWVDKVKAPKKKHGGLSGFMGNGFWHVMDAVAAVGGAVVAGGVASAAGAAMGLSSAPASLSATGTPALESLSSAELAANMAATNSAEIAGATTALSIPSAVETSIAIPGTSAAVIPAASVPEAAAVAASAGAATAPAVAATTTASSTAASAASTAAAAKAGITVADVLAGTKAVVSTVGAIKTIDTVINKDAKMDTPTEKPATSVPLATAQPSNAAGTANTISTDAVIILAVIGIIIYALEGAKK